MIAICVCERRKKYRTQQAIKVMKHDIRCVRVDEIIEPMPSLQRLLPFGYLCFLAQMASDSSTFFDLFIPWCLHSIKHVKFLGIEQGRIIVGANGTMFRQPTELAEMLRVLFKFTFELEWWRTEILNLWERIEPVWTFYRMQRWHRAAWMEPSLGSRSLSLFAIILLICERAIYPHKIGQSRLDHIFFLFLLRRWICFAYISKH